MTKQYPRKYVVVKDGQFEKVTVNNPIQEMAITLSHAEALGLNKPVPFDNSRFVIPDKSTEGE